MPRELDSAPSIELIRELYDHNQTYWSKQTTLDKQLISMYFDDEPVAVPKTDDKRRRFRIEPEKMTSGEASRTIDMITALYTQPATIGVQWTGEGKKGPSIGDQIEIGLNEAIDQLNPAVDSPRKRELWQFVTLGRSARLMCPGDSYYWGFPFREDGESEDAWHKRYSEWSKRGPLPILWLDLPAESTFPPSFGALDDEILSVVQMSRSELEEVFSPEELAPLAPKERFQKTEPESLAIYSNHRYLAYAWLGTGDNIGITTLRKEDTLLRTVEHKLGRPAIRILPGMTTGRKEPGRYWLSAIFHVRDLIKAGDRRLSEAATASKFDALPMFKMRLQELGGKASEVVKALAGDIFLLKTDRDGMKAEDIEPLYQPQFGEKTQELAAFILARIERMTGAVPSLEGDFGPTGMPAWSRNFSAELAKRKFAPLTDAIVAADLDAAEQIIRSTVAWGEPISLARRKGDEGGNIVLDPLKLENWEPVLKSEFRLQLPINRRADLDLMVSIMERSRASGLPISPAWLMETLGGIEQPWQMYKEALTWDWALSAEVKSFYLRQLLSEAEIQDDEGMSVQEFMTNFAEKMPPGAAQAIMQRAGGGMGPDAQGMVQAGSTFGRPPGGPTPQEE